MSSQPRPGCIGLEYYTLSDLRALLEHSSQLVVAPEVRERVEAGARYVGEKALQDEHIYAVNTGFGSLCETRVDAEMVEELQHRQILSHACGVGSLAPERIVRLMILIKLLTFRTGHTGISMAVVDRLLEHLRRGVIPAVPGKGTVGASGDLAPLAHMALPLIGKGKVLVEGEVRETGEVLGELGWEPLRLRAKEGVALTNGVQYINAIAVDCLLRAEELIRSADLIAALSIQGFSASSTFYHRTYHETSWHAERQTVAQNLRRLLDGSNHFDLPTCNRSKQDPYSFRCIPQVHAAVRQTARHARDVVERECNSVSDNPLFFPEEDLVLCGGNLHGESTAFVLDFLAVAMSELANISERRSYQLLSGQRGLPVQLVRDHGLNSGFMVAQYTAAALVNENKVLSTPASVDTIPTCQMQEDTVSMGGTSAYKLCQILDNCETVLAIELLLAMQAIDMNEGLRLSPKAARAHERFRREVPFLDTDRLVADDIDGARRFFLAHRSAWSDQVE